MEQVTGASKVIDTDPVGSGGPDRHKNLVVVGTSQTFGCGPLLWLGSQRKFHSYKFNITKFDTRSSFVSIKRSKSPRTVSDPTEELTMLPSPPSWWGGEHPLSKNFTPLGFSSFAHRPFESQSSALWTSPVSEDPTIL